MSQNAVNPIRNPMVLEITSSVSHSPLWVISWINSMMLEIPIPIIGGSQIGFLMTIGSRKPIGINNRILALISNQVKSSVKYCRYDQNGSSTIRASVVGLRVMTVATRVRNRYGINRLNAIRRTKSRRLAIIKTPTNITAAAM